MLWMMSATTVNALNAGQGHAVMVGHNTNKQLDCIVCRMLDKTNLFRNDAQECKYCTGLKLTFEFLTFHLQ